MPRKTRIKSESGFYHVMCRGNNKEKIFKDINNKYFYYNLVKSKVLNSGVQIYAWCIMDNHVHLFLKGNLDKLSTAIQCLNTTFAIKYNQDNDRVGHVFQGRFKSEVVENRQYFLALIRYIHCNPVKASICNKCDEYKWSSFRDFKFKNGLISNEINKTILKYFDGRFNSFNSFHYVEDKIEFADIDVDILRKRKFIVKCEIEEYCIENNINIDLIDEPAKKKIAKNLLVTYNYKIDFIAKELDLSIYKIRHIRDRINREKAWVKRDSP